MKTKKKVLIAVVAIVFLLIVAIISSLIISENNTPTAFEDIGVSEFNLAFSGLRLAGTSSALDGTGALSRRHFETLGEMARQIDRSKEWFSGSDDILYVYVIIQDTQDREIISISDGAWTATFYAAIHEEERGRFGSLSERLVSYTFERAEPQGHQIQIVNE